MSIAAEQVPQEEPVIDSSREKPPKQKVVADGTSNLRELKDALTRCIFLNDKKLKKGTLDQTDKLKGYQNVTESNLRELEDTLIGCLSLENDGVQRAAGDLLSEHGDSITAQKLEKLIESNKGSSVRMAGEVLLSLSWKHREFADSTEGQYGRIKTLSRALLRKRKPTRPLRALAIKA